MMPFSEAPVTLICLVGAFALVDVVLWLAFAIADIRARAKWLTIVLDCAAVVFLCGFTILLRDMTGFEGSVKMNERFFPWVNVSLEVAVLIIGLALIGALIRFVYVQFYAPKRIGPTSIKEALDTLSAGVCFFGMDGNLILSNVRMHELYRYLSDYTLQSYVELKRTLALCQQGENPLVAFEADSGLYRFPDGKVWRYTQSTIGREDSPEDDVSRHEGIIEVVFTDVTELRLRQGELEEQTRQLQASINNLEALSKNTLALTREREIIDAKAALHDQMGVGLTALRRCLDKPGDDEADRRAIEFFNNALFSICSNENLGVESEELDAFMQDAAFVHIDVTITGKLPSRRAVCSLFLAAMRECLTNAVRHSDASELHVRIGVECGRDCAYDKIVISDNGTPPKENIVPKGGLANVQEVVQRYSGKMTIDVHPRFALSIAIPVKEKVTRECGEDAHPQGSGAQEARPQDTQSTAKEESNDD